MKIYYNLLETSVQELQKIHKSLYPPIKPISSIPLSTLIFKPIIYDAPNANNHKKVPPACFFLRKSLFILKKIATQRYARSRRGQGVVVRYYSTTTTMVGGSESDVTRKQYRGDELRGCEE